MMETPEPAPDPTRPHADAGRLGRRDEVGGRPALLFVLGAALALPAGYVLIRILGATPRFFQRSQDVPEILLWALWVLVALDLTVLGVILLRRAVAARAGTAGRRWLKATLLIAAVGVPLALITTTWMSPRWRGHPPRPHHQTVDNLRNIAALLEERGDRKGAWPPYDGRGFVLSVVAHGDIDLRNPENLAVFFPDPLEGWVVPPAAAYREVTVKSLATRRFPQLTAFAGRRNRDPRYRITPEASARGVPVVAYVVPGGESVLVAFSNLSVKELRKEDLGLAPDEAILFGEGSPSPLLRALSLE